MNSTWSAVYAPSSFMTVSHDTGEYMRPVVFSANKKMAYMIALKNKW